MRGTALLAAAVMASLSFAPCGDAGVRLGSAFTYQGLLKSVGSPADGIFHLRFQLWNALVGGAQVGADVDAPAVAVSAGLFTLPLDFGSDVFDGSARWLQVQVVTDGGAIVTSLSPRQPITAAPYAVQTRGIFVNDAGNVGIGHSAPPALLSVQSTTANPSNNTALFGAPSIGPWTSHIHFGETGDWYIRSADSEGQVILQDTGGNVGIGTSQPLSRLHIATPTIGPWDSHIHFGENGDWYIRSAASDGKVILQDTGGNVGIGTSGPQNTLHVESDSVLAILANNTHAVGDGMGVLGRAESTTGIGVEGRATSSSGVTNGVRGVSNSVTGFDFYAAGAGTNYGSSSSIRWKDNIKAIDDPLTMIEALRGVYFDWDAEHGGHHDVGMIAEEVGAVLPEIVQYEENGIDAIGMDYSKLTPLLVEAVKALRAEKDAELAALAAEKDAQIDDLKSQISDLQSQNQSVQSQLDALRRQLEALATLVGKGGDK